MHAYGDESGHLRNVLSGDSDVFVLAVVAGGRHDCGGCPKQVVRRATDLREVKWNDLPDHEKRRVVDCFGERNLRFGYVAIEKRNLLSLSNSYLLHQDRLFDTDWDLAVIGLGYSTLLSAVMRGSDEAVSFTFDKLFGAAQSDQVLRAVESVHSGVEIRYATSHSTLGIQAADCIAGAIADTYRTDRNWLDSLNADLRCRTNELLREIDQRLRDGDRTGP